MRAAFTANIVLAMVAVVLRLVSRRIIGAQLKADDFTIIAALVGKAGHLVRARLILLQVVTLGEYGVSMFGSYLPLSVSSSEMGLLIPYRAPRGLWTACSPFKVTIDLRKGRCS